MYTRGKWQFCGNKIIGAPGYAVATINSSGTTEGRDNGLLVAAAPSMFEALSEIAAKFPDSEAAAIAKLVLLEIEK